MLVARAQAGDEQARNELVVHFWSKVKTYREDDRAEFAERLIKFFDRGWLDPSRHVGTIYAYVFRMMKNVHTGNRRKDSYEWSKSPELVRNSATVELPGIREIGATDIDDPTIRLLIERSRENGGIEGVFTNVAAELGISRQTLYKRIRKFREAHQLSDFI